jgi:hypothetical protein
MELEKEHFFQCPFCGEHISMLFDLTSNTTDYIEDCEVCCRPVLISYEVSDLQIINLKIERS